MNKTAGLGLSVALFLPLVSYYIVKFAGEDVVHMPRRYFADSVIENTKDG